MSDMIKIASGNLFSGIPHAIADEVFDTILSSDRCKIERIISRGQKSPSNYWYDQEKDEWVMVVQGAAKLKFKNGGNIIEMLPGDYLHIPAHCEHRVEWTDPDVETIWLAVHY
jgi:cupin 2 domain-containing protein